MVSYLHEPGLFDSFVAIPIDESAALHTAFLSDLAGAWLPLLGHLGVLSPALINDVHSYLHAELLLLLC